MNNIKQKTFSYNWNISDGYPVKNGYSVFSCFSCGGGSSFGYKLAGFDVVGFNEIDPKIAKVYKDNHSPKFCFIEDIRKFKNRSDLPKELFNLDILDGSPPCSSFSMSGNREKDWSKEKKFAEGQSVQVLDTLFFDFIDVAKKLQSKVVVAENVKGLLLGKAKKYVREIYKQFDAAGYYCQHFLLDASKMSVPQKRQRVFFVCLRKDLAGQFLYKKDLFTIIPKINLSFNYREISFGQATSDLLNSDRRELSKTAKKYYYKTKPGDSFSKAHEKGSLFNWVKIDSSKPCPTITFKGSDMMYRQEVEGPINEAEILRVSSFPNDFKASKSKKRFAAGMSVPPVMIANIAQRIKTNWLDKF